MIYMLSFILCNFNNYCKIYEGLLIFFENARRLSNKIKYSKLFFMRIAKMEAYYIDPYLHLKFHSILIIQMQLVYQFKNIILKFIFELILNYFQKHKIFVRFILLATIFSLLRLIFWNQCKPYKQFNIFLVT